MGGGNINLCPHLTNEQIPHQVGEWIQNSGMNKWVFFLITGIFFLLLGTFLESISIILITLPILLPMIEHLGINLYHFAIVMVVNLELGMITPPVGLNLFVVAGMAKEKLTAVARGVLPFILLFLASLVIIILFPQISIWLPQFME